MSSNQSILTTPIYTAPREVDTRCDDEEHFPLDSQHVIGCSDDEQLDDTPFLKHLLPLDQESFSEKFLRNILTHDYQNLMPRRREKFVEVTKTVTVTEIVNGAAENHPSSCEVKISNFSPTGPHPVNVSIKHLHEKWHSSEDLDAHGKGTTILIQETQHSLPLENRNVETVDTEIYQQQQYRRKCNDSVPLFDRSSDNIVDLQFSHPILIETYKRNDMDRKLKKISTTTTTIETEKTTRKRSMSSYRKFSKPEVQTLHYRKFVETEDCDEFERERKRSHSADPKFHEVDRKLNSYEKECWRENGVDEEQSPAGNTIVSMNNPHDHQTLKAGITSISMNETTGSRYSTIPRSRTSKRKLSHSDITHIGTSEGQSISENHLCCGHEITMNVHIEHGRSQSSTSLFSEVQTPQKTSNVDAHGEGTVDTVDEQTVKNVNPEGLRRKITENRRPPDINIIECDNIANETKSPIRTPATPIVVVNQNSSRRNSHDFLSDAGQRRRKSTVTDIDWYAAFNMKDPTNSTKVTWSGNDERDITKRRSSDTSATDKLSEIDFNKVFVCSNFDKSKECHCTACRWIEKSGTANEHYTNTELDIVSTADIKLEDRLHPDPPIHHKDIKSSKSSSTVDDNNTTAIGNIDHTEVIINNPGGSQLHDFPIDLLLGSSNDRQQQNLNLTEKNSKNDWTRRTSTTRKISLDGSRKNHGAQLLLPPSDVSLDIIFAALSPQTKEEEPKSVTEKTATQNMEKVETSEQPVAPPRVRKNIRSEEKVPAISMIENVGVNDNIQNAQKVEEKIVTTEFDNNMEDVFNPQPIPNVHEETSAEAHLYFDPATTSEAEDTRSIDEVKSRDQNEHLQFVTTEISLDSRDSDINIDEVFKSFQPQINMNDDDTNEHIRMRIAEFENSREKVVRKTDRIEITRSKESIDDQSTILMEDVFNPQPIHENTSNEANLHIEPDIPTEVETRRSIDEVNSKGQSDHLEFVTTQILLDSKDSDINIDEVFKSFQPQINKNDDDTNEHIRMRIAEFERSREKVSQKTEQIGTIRSKDSIDEQSEILMEDVFNPQPVTNVHEDTSNKANLHIETDIPAEIEDTRSIDEVNSKDQNDHLQFSKAQIVLDSKDSDISDINIDEVFKTIPPQINKNDDDANEHIRRRIAEFENSREKITRKTDRTETTRSKHSIDEQSTILMDDVFNPQSIPNVHENTSVEANLHIDSDIPTEADDTMSIEVPNSTDQNEHLQFVTTEILLDSNDSDINIDEVFESIQPKINKNDDDTNEHIRMRIAEFERSREKVARRTDEIETTRSKDSNDEQSAILMEDVFNPQPITNDDENDNNLHFETSDIPTEVDATRTIDEVNSKDQTEHQQFVTTQILLESRDSDINIDEVFKSFQPQINKNDDDTNEHIRMRIAEFENSREKVVRKTDRIETTRSKDSIDEQSTILMEDVFNPQPIHENTNAEADIHFDSDIRTEAKDTMSMDEVKSKNQNEHLQTSTTQILLESKDSDINIDEVFKSFQPQINKNDDDIDEHIRMRIAEFERSREKVARKTDQIESTRSKDSTGEQSEILMDDVFNPQQIHENTNAEANLYFDPATPSETEETRSMDKVISKDENEHSQFVTTEISLDSRDSDINIDDVFKCYQPQINKNDDDTNEHIRMRIAEFENSREKVVRKTDRIEITRLENSIDEQSKILMDDVYNPQPIHENTSNEAYIHIDPATPTEAEATRSIEEQSVIPLNDVFLPSAFQKLHSLTPDMWNESFVSESSTISIDDPFDNSYCASETNMGSVFISPPDTMERTKRKPRMQGYRMIETVVEMEDRTETRDNRTQRKCESEENQYNVPLETIMSDTMFQYEENHFQSSDDNWISSVVYRPTAESSSYVLKAAPGVEDYEKIDCQIFANSSKRCECSACALTIDDIENMKRKRKIEAVLENKIVPNDEVYSTDHSYFSNTERSFIFTQSQDAILTAVFNNPRQIHENTSAEANIHIEPDIPTEVEYTRSPIDEVSPKDQDEHLQSVTTKILLDSRDSDINIDEVFKSFQPQINKNDDDTNEHIRMRIAEFENSREKNVRRTDRIEIRKLENSIDERSTILMEDVFNPQQIHENTSAEENIHFEPDIPTEVEDTRSTDVRGDSISLPFSEQYNSRTSEVDTGSRYKQMEKSQFSLDQIFPDCRRLSDYYEERSDWDTIKSQDSGVLSTGGKRDLLSIDELRQLNQTNEKVENLSFEEFYITSRDDNKIDDIYTQDTIDVTKFVDDIFGKSLDEAAFLQSAKWKYDCTDTSIDKKNESKMWKTDSWIDTGLIEEQETQKIVETKNDESEENESSEKLTVELKGGCFVINCSFSIVVPKHEPLGKLLQKSFERHHSLDTLDILMTPKIKKLLIECLKEKMIQKGVSGEPGVSSRGQSLITSIDNASTTFLRMNDNKYHHVDNPDGIVNFCTAENNLCTPLLLDHFKHLELFFPNTEHLVRYPPQGGWPETRQILAKYFKEFMNAHVELDELVLTASTRTGYDVVSYCLFEQNDVLLTNGPVYTGTLSNCNERALCQVECVATNLTHPQLDVSKYQEQLDKMKDENVAGIIIVNPHNPLGVVFPPEEVIQLCDWAANNNLRVIIDEVFANCVFEQDTLFQPYLSYRHRVSRPENVTYLWSVSKDFGLPGLKFAVIHSQNDALRQAALKLQLYHPCSSYVQDFTVNLLSNFEWVHSFHTEVQRRIRIHYQYTAENLTCLGIPFVQAQAGIFVFADFSKYLNHLDEESEIAFWDRLFEGVMLTPGVHQKCESFGWFRLVYSCTKEELEEGFKRLYNFIKPGYKPIGAVEYS